MRSKQTRVVHVTTVPQTLAFLHGQIDYVRSKGFEIHVASAPGDELANFSREQSVPSRGVPLTRAITPWSDLKAICQLWGWFRELRPTIVHAHTPKGGLVGMVAAFLARVPVRIYHIRGLPLQTATGLQRFIFRCTESITCRLAHRVLIVSHSLGTRAVRVGICPQEKITTLGHGSGNGVDARRRFNPSKQTQGVGLTLRHEMGIPQKALVIGFVGRIVGDKGVVDLAEAWTVLRKRLPQAHLLIVGPFEKRDAIPDEIKRQLEEDPRVHLPGCLDSLPFYSVMNLLVLPTYREGFPNVLLEAAAMELPVVATRVEGCTDAVLDGETGTLVAARDAGALATAITLYARNETLRRQHGLAGRARVLKYFRPEHIWQAVVDEYESLLKQRGLSTAKTERPVTARRKAA